MEDNACVAFLQWALPRLNLRWSGFRKVRRQVCRRIDRRIAELGLPDIDSYKKYLTVTGGEWAVLDHFCRITISRFYRDRLIFDYLGTEVLPLLSERSLQRDDRVIRAWSGGCASGEEPYTLALIYHFLIREQFPDVHVEISATDIDPAVLERAQNGCYNESSLRDLPAHWRQEAFVYQHGMYSLKPFVKTYVRFSILDIREQAPAGTFDLIFCRNLAFTYFNVEIQRSVLARLFRKLADRGVLVIGLHENLPDNDLGLIRWLEHMPIYEKNRTLQGYGQSSA